jgi:hypothetical protein
MVAKDIKRSLPNSPPSSDPLEQESPTRVKVTFVVLPDDEDLVITKNRITLPDPYAFDEESDEEDIILPAKASCARTAGVQRAPFQPDFPLKRRLSNPDTPPAKKITPSHVYAQAAFAQSLKENTVPKLATPPRALQFKSPRRTPSPKTPRKTPNREYRTSVLKREYVKARTQAALKRVNDKPMSRIHSPAVRKSPRNSPKSSPNSSPRKSKSPRTSPKTPHAQDLWNTARWKPLEKPVRRMSLSSPMTSELSEVSSELDIDAIDFLSTARYTLLEELNSKILVCKNGLRRKKMEAQRKLILEGFSSPIASTQ